MPHRVADFFSNEGLNHIKASVQRRKSPQSSRRGSREGVIGNYSSASSSSEEVNNENRTQTQTHSHSHNHNNQRSQTPERDGPAPEIMPHATAPLIRMPELPKREKGEKSHHRLSLPTFHFGGHLKGSKEPPSNPYAGLDWKIESPPVVMHGDTDNSTGAIVSGQLLLNIKEIPVEIESFDASLDIHVTQKRPYTGHCGGCSRQKTNLKKWNFLSEPTTMSKRTFAFPFSALLEGHLPASTDNNLISIRYEFVAEAKCKVGGPLKLSKTINVRRALPVPEQPHHSVRIFPPTNIAASVHYPQVIHPIGANKLTLRLDGIVKHNVDVKSVEYWKLKRVNWKLEETIKTVAPACDKHNPKIEDATGEPETQASTRKGNPRTVERIVGSGDLFRGWKADYSPGGTVDAELEFHCGATADPHTSSSATALQSKLAPSCDLRSRDGTEITHQLVVEMVVVHEYASLSNLKHVTPTGVARVLRMHFAVTVTERGGLGVSWDNEAPPIYQDVPPSPPGYWCEVPPSDDDDDEVDMLEPLSGGSSVSSGASTPSYEASNSAASSSAGSSRMESLDERR